MSQPSIAVFRFTCSPITANHSATLLNMCIVAALLLSMPATGYADIHDGQQLQKIAVVQEVRPTFIESEHNLRSVGPFSRTLHAI
jgi:hypothetical protein